MRIGLDAEFGLIASTSAQAVERGIRVAISEINASGGVLGGRRLELVTRDNRSVPARSQENIRELAAIPDLVAVFCGRFSPVVLEGMALVHQLHLPLLDPWASADAITDNGFTPNYVFRLSLRDRWAMPTMLRHAARQGASRVGLLLPNTGWGRSNHAAAQQAAGPEIPAIVGEVWYNWGDKSLAAAYYGLLRKGAQAVLFVANDSEAAVLMREMLAMPASERVPLVMHWGVTGGDLTERVGAAMAELDLAVVQTFSFLSGDPGRVAHFMQRWRAVYGPTALEAIAAPVGVAHAYDLTHLLARAINKAGSTDRARIRDALENLGAYDGLVRRYRRPFTPDDHEALGPENVFMAGFRANGAIVPLPAKKGGR